MSNETISVSKDCPECISRKEFIKVIKQNRNGKGEEVYNIGKNTIELIEELNRNCTRCKGSGRVTLRYTIAEFKKLL